MTLTARMRLCKEDGCKRTPRTAELGFCDEHQPRWVPEWRRRSLVKDFSGRAA